MPESSRTPTSGPEIPEMPSTKDQSRAPEEQMNCMEVWGGSCASNDCLRRPGLDIWVKSNAVESAECGGGDVHLLSSCASGRITRMLLADICGIGPLFSEIASELRDLMKRNVNAIQQERIVREVSMRLDIAAQKGGFASLLISTYFAPTRSLKLCNTGHPPPFIYRTEDSEWSMLKQTPDAAPSRFVTDSVVAPHEYQQIQTKLNVGDMVFSYSNGLTECRDSDGNILGLTGLLDRIRKIDVGEPDKFPAKLVQQLRDEHDENAQVDDATLLLCRATETKVGIRDNFLAPFRLLRSVSDNTRIE